MNEIVPPPSRSRPRWWLLAVILALGGMAWLALGWAPQRSQQHYNLNAARIVLGTLAACLLWLTVLSRLSWHVRRTVYVGILAIVGLSAAVFRYRGVDGNLIPIFEFRWAGPPAPEVAAPAGPASSEVPPGAADFGQFLGPTRDGILSGLDLATNWDTQPPRLQWRRPMGAAWSGFAVAGAIAITQEQQGESEVVAAYDLGGGALLWKHADSTHFTSTLAGEGPRATPTVYQGRVFTLGATGILNCLDVATGRLLWTIPLGRKANGAVPDWGFAGSPLVFDDVVVVNPGAGHGTVVAYAIADGSRKWGGGRRGASYSSPLDATIDGVRQILLFGEGFAGYEVGTGAELWRFPWPSGHPHIAMPVRVAENDWIISSGYGTGSGRVRVSRGEGGQWSAEEVWKTNRMKSKFANPVLHRGHIYGLDDGVLACLNVETGDLRWREGKYGHGQVLRVGDRLLVMAEKGAVVLVDPQPVSPRELGRFQALNGKTWNPPALAGQYLVVRNDREAACYKLPIRENAGFLHSEGTKAH